MNTGSDKNVVEKLRKLVAVEVHIHCPECDKELVGEYHSGMRGESGFYEHICTKCKLSFYARNGAGGAYPRIELRFEDNMTSVTELDLKAIDSQCRRWARME